MTLAGRPLTATLRDVSFLHWPVSTTLVDGLLPDWLASDSADGSAWISALSMGMRRFDVLGLPVRENVRAVALRTYVRGPSGDRGVYFLSLDVTDRPAAETARRVFRLPSYPAEVDRSADGARTSVELARRDRAGTTFEVTYEPSGSTQAASPDTLASFLAERYRYFTEGPLGTRLVGSVGHDPWSLQSANATVTDGSLLADVGLDDVDGRPLAHHSDGTEMRIGPPVPVTVAD